MLLWRSSFPSFAPCSASPTDKSTNGLVNGARGVMVDRGKIRRGATRRMRANNDREVFILGSQEEVRGQRVNVKR